MCEQGQRRARPSVAGSRGGFRVSKAIRVLIADDHALLREGLRKILEMESDMCVVGEAVDGLDTRRRGRSVPTSS